MQMFNIKDEKTMEDEIKDLLNKDLLECTKYKGYNDRIYTLYELRTTANSYSSREPEEYRKFIKDKYAKIYNYSGEKIPIELIKEVYGVEIEEKWNVVAGYSNEDFLVSSYGRIKHRPSKNEEYRLVYQDEDSCDLYKGYLRPQRYLTEDKIEYKGSKNYSYHFIAYGFFRELWGKGLDIHHINNNGYDCRPENLILLEPREHSKAHGFFVISDKKRD